MYARPVALIASFLFIVIISSHVLAEDWPQWRGVNRDAKIDDPQLVSSLPSGQIPLTWTVPVGPGYSGPTVSQERVYLTDRQGQSPDTVERVLCFDARDGKQLWEHIDPVAYSIGYEASGPRASVTVHQGKAISLGGMGKMNCLDAVSGEVIWARDLAADYSARIPIWGMTAAPLVYDDLVIQVAAGSGDSCIVGLELATGKERWRALDERAAYSAPIVIQQGGEDVLVCWTGESVTGLDPRTGEVHWSIEMKPRNMPIGVATPVVHEDKLFVSSFYDG
ncbi:MAG: PQQ-binding-like beta-propeller repeat protein [Planctomycetota bacterium]